MTAWPPTRERHQGGAGPARDDGHLGMPAHVVELVVGVTVVVAAAAVSLGGAPVAVRSLLALPVVVGVAGRGATILLLGPRPSPAVPCADPSSDVDRHTVLDEPTLRAVAPVLFGVIATLAAILVVSALRLTITSQTVTVASAAAAVALHVAAALLRRDASPRPSWTGRARGLVRTGVPALAALALLVVAVGGARAVESERVERYTQLSLVDPAVYATGGLRSTPGSRFQVGWVLRAYAMPLADSPPVSLTVAARPPTGLQQKALEPSTDVTDADASRRGLVSALAPQAPGLYRLALTVGAGEQAQTLYLVLEVTS